jgi:Aspartyl protease
MKLQSLCNSLSVLLATASAFASISSQAEPRCPGNIAGLTPRIVAGALLVIPVKINKYGPFDFMVDTGSQVTVIDPRLASELHLKPQGTVGLVSAASYANASVTLLDTLEANSHAVERPYAIVQDLGQIQAVDSRIRGVLGENFLAHFDLFIDYAHKLLCLDETAAMRDQVHGERIPFVRPEHPESEVPFTERLVISVQLSGIGDRQILLQLDSGSDGPILYARNGGKELPLLRHATPRKGNVSIGQSAFADLPLQDLRIGKRTLSRIPFVTPVSAGKDVPGRDEDGLLPTLLFQRVFICGADHYVVLDPR